jgi:hypothetical protein
VKPAANPATDYQATTAVAALSSGASVAAGTFNGTATFGSGEAKQTTLVAASGFGESSTFIAHYAGDGSLAWAKSADTPGGQPASVAPLPDQTLLVTGGFNGVATFGSGEPTQTTLSSGFALGSTSAAMFLAHYDGSGALLWAKDFVPTATGGFQPTASPLSIAGCATATTAVVGGAFRGSLDCGGTTLNYTGAQLAPFVAGYHADGSLLFAKQAQPQAGIASAYGVVRCVRCAPDGSFVATGWYAQSITFGTGEAHQTTLTSGQNYESLFVARFQADGTLEWAKGLTTQTRGWGIAAVPDGSSIVVGDFTGTAIFGPGEPNQTTLTGVPSSPSGLYVARYNSDGTLAWAKSVSPATSAPIEAEAVDALPDGSSIVVGEFGDQTTFGAGEASQTTLTTNGGATPFIARYNADGTLAWARSVVQNNYGYFRVVAISGELALTGAQLTANDSLFGANEPNQTHVTSKGSTAFVAGYYTTPH